MAKTGVADQDRAVAISRLLSGLARGDDFYQLAAAIEGLHPSGNTFPGEVFMRLSVTALELAGAGPDTPIPYDGLIENYLAEHTFNGKQNRKIQFVILGATALRGGIEPDLLSETYWWQTDDFWWYALAASVATIRACADKAGVPVTDFVQRMSK
jgi:hypothetical protein